MRHDDYPKILLQLEVVSNVMGDCTQCLYAVNSKIFDKDDAALFPPRTPSQTKNSNAFLSI